MALADLFQYATSMMGYIIPFLIILTIVVFIHELGHFWVARRCGVKVLTFSVGFGPEIFGFHDRQGTRWRLAAIPLGGYVRFFGDSNAASTPDFEGSEQMNAAEKRVSFMHKPVWQRASIVFAGPAANFILAFVVYMLVFSLLGKPVMEARISEVRAESPAAQAGFQAGDVIRSVNQAPIGGFSDFQRVVSISAGKPLNIVVQRDEQDIVLQAVPAEVEIDDGYGGKIKVGQLGVGRAVDAANDVTYIRYGMIDSAALSINEMYFILSRSVHYFAGLFMGRESLDQIGGPIRIAQISGDAAAIGWGASLNLLAILSLSIGFLNLFPVPLLDGGHLVFYAIEALRGKPLSVRAQEIGFRFGLMFVIALMFVANWNDISRLL